MRRFLPLAALALCAACQRGGPKIERPSIDAKAFEKSGAEGQWLDADGAGETTLVYRLQAQVVDFVLTCRKRDKSLTVKAAYAGPTPTQGEPASLLLGASAVEASVVDEPGLSGPGAVATRTPVNSLVITALANARSVRMTFRGESVETGQDANGKLRYFAQRCSQLTE